MAKFLLKETIDPKILYNIGATMDIPTGFIVTGARGESTINGGLGALFAVVGMGNRFKSTILHYAALKAVGRLLDSGETFISTYDTEVNMDEITLSRFTEAMEEFEGKDVFNPEDPIWQITDKSKYLADEWVKELRAFLAEREKDKKGLVVFEPFVKQGEPFKNRIPGFIEVDSLSEFESANTIGMQDKTALGDSAGNTIFMKQGLTRTRFLMDLPRLAGRSNTCFLMTAQMGKDMNIQVGPISAPPPKKLQFLKIGDKIKGVTDKFFFLLWSAYYVTDAKPMINQSTKASEYPHSKDYDDPNELHLARMVQLRSKTGPTGYTLELVISQNEGVLPDMTEFHNIKQHKRYGLGGNDRNYFLELYPDTSLSRTTIRTKLREDKRLRRALNITSEMCQIQKFMPHLRSIMCTPAELRADLEKKGYKWDELLDTRGYWVPNQYEHPVPFLSTVDLLKMRAGTYKPYWMK